MAGTTDQGQLLQFAPELKRGILSGCACQGTHILMEDAAAAALHHLKGRLKAPTVQVEITGRNITLPVNLTIIYSEMLTDSRIPQKLRQILRTGRSIQMALMGVTVGILLITLSLVDLHRGDATATPYSLEPRFNEMQPKSFIHLHRQLTAMSSNVSISATPDLLGKNGEPEEVVTVSYTKYSGASAGDWIGLFSPAKFDGRQCLADLNLTNNGDEPPYICNAPIKFQYANLSSPDYVKTGKGTLKVLVINQRYDYAFGFFSGDVTNPVLEGISNTITFKYPKAPVWPRLALGKEWNQMSVTWTSGYSPAEAKPVAIWKLEEDVTWTTTVGITVTYEQYDMCGPPASTVGFRDPGYTHTVFFNELEAESIYVYQVGHKLKGGGYVWGPGPFPFQSTPYPGADSLQSIIIFGDMGKTEPDGWTEYFDDQKGALIVRDALLKEVGNVDLVIHNGDIVYADGYLAEWEQYAYQISNITNRVPWMLSAGNHERDWPGSSSWYVTGDSGGECGVVMSNMYKAPTFNKDKYWYSLDYGKFHICVGNSEFDWRPGTEQYAFIEECFASVDRSAQPWLIFLAHRVLGYSSGPEYQALGNFAEPYSREYLQDLWQKYKVNVASYGHVHQYERSCPVYQERCVGTEEYSYSGQFNATIHIVAGTGGRNTDLYGVLNTSWSLVKDYTYSWGYLKFTSPDPQTLLVEFIAAKDGTVHDNFTITQTYTDVLGCDSSLAPICPAMTSADL